jgi:hypothetical protein
MGNPFSPHDRRMKFYLVGSLIMAAMLSRTTLASSSIANYITNPVTIEKAKEIEFKAALGVGFFSIYVIYAIFSVAYAYRLNTRPGFSAGLRNAFIRNHIYYVMVFVMTWIPFLGLCYYIMYTTNAFLSLMIEPNPTPEQQ